MTMYIVGNHTPEGYDHDYEAFDELTTIVKKLCPYVTDISPNSIDGADISIALERVQSRTIAGVSRELIHVVGMALKKMNWEFMEDIV